MSLFMVLEGEDKLIKMDSFIRLSSMLEDKCRISTSSQHIWCPSCHACSAIGERPKSATRHAAWCSLMRVPNFRPDSPCRIKNCLLSGWKLMKLLTD